MFVCSVAQIVCEFHLELDELEKFMEELIKREELPVDRKDAFEEYVRVKVRERRRKSNGRTIQHCIESVNMFREMHTEGITMDETDISSVLPAAGDSEDACMGLQVHGCAIQSGVYSEDACMGLQVHGCAIQSGVYGDTCVARALIDFYGKCRRV